jgi:hypothetical protein
MSLLIFQKKEAGRKEPYSLDGNKHSLALGSHTVTNVCVRIYLGLFREREEKSTVSETYNYD